MNVSGISSGLNNFSDVKHCKGMLQNTITNFKNDFKGLNNLYKFSNEKIIEAVERHSTDSYQYRGQ